MNSEKSPSQKSTTSGDPNSNSNDNTIPNNGASSNCTACNSLEETEENKPKIDLHEFLDFLNVSCHVNEMIANDSYEREANKSTPNPLGRAKTKPTVNFKKLAENRLVNELYGLKNASSTRPADEIVDLQQNDCKTTNGKASERIQQQQFNSCSGSFSGTHSSSSTAAPTWQPWKKSESTRTTFGSGLHPKLNEKLDFVINEGVLDSVLPFICPVQIPTNASTRTKAKPKEESNKKDKEASPTETEMNKSPPVNEAEKETVLAAGDTPQGMVKFKEHRSSISRKLSSQTSTRLQSLSNVAIEDKREPEVIIHVCDEVKNTTKDFSCPQNLLVSKMGYFADVTAGQKLDDMDISVHCDIHIFDWLMRWVKHSVSSTTPPSASLDAGPQLDATNVVPILVSASFLQMEPLFADCLSFCHSRLSEVVRVSTNLSCLNDSIMTRLAAMFTNAELEMVRDKKERVTPRLWTKLIQSLCEPEPEALRGHFFSLAGLFRCSKCEKCLTNTMKSYISCLPSNVRLNRWGQLVSHHVRDSAWDINVYINQLFKEQKSWRKVYWKLWGHCHFLYCCACEAHFPVYQMAWCRYHPEMPNFLGPVTEGRMSGPTGRYPCCGQQAFRFETMPGPNGCQFREHSVLVETDRERAILNILQLVNEGHGLCESPPMKLQESIVNEGDFEPRWNGLSLMPQRCRQGLLPALNPDESVSRLARRVRRGASNYFMESSSESDTTDTLGDTPNHNRRRYLQSNTCVSYSSSSDGCESDFSDIKTTHSKKKQRKRQTDTPGRYWSGELSARSNQDHQREFEEKVMKQVVAIVSKKIGSEHTALQNSSPLGGTYVRLEAEWKEQLRQRSNNNQGSSTATNAAAYGSSLSLSTTVASATSSNTKQKNK